MMVLIVRCGGWGIKVTMVVRAAIVGNYGCDGSVGNCGYGGDGGGGDNDDGNGAGNGGGGRNRGDGGGGSNNDNSGVSLVFIVVHGGGNFVLQGIK